MTARDNLVPQWEVIHQKVDIGMTAREITRAQLACNGIQQFAMRLCIMSDARKAALARRRGNAAYLRGDARPVDAREAEGWDETARYMALRGYGREA